MPLPDVAGPWLVFGASGQVGRCVLRRCRERGQPLLAVSRRENASSAGLSWLVGELPATVPSTVAAPVVLSLGPLDLFSQWLVDGGSSRVDRVVALSSMSVSSKMASPNADERALAERLQQAEDRLVRACENAAVPWTILRPTLIWGVGLDRSLTPLAKTALRRQWMPMPGARGLRQPVHADDVAAAAVAAADRPEAAGWRIECGGGERLAAAEMFRRVRASLPGKVRRMPVPALLSRLARPFGRYSQRAAMLARLQDDLVADNSRMQTLLGVNPRPFAPTLEAWAGPEVHGK